MLLALPWGFLKLCSVDNGKATSEFCPREIAEMYNSADTTGCHESNDPAVVFSTPTYIDVM